MSARLIGGEMLIWSDLDGAHGPGPVRGSVLAPFLAAARGRTLVAGPHDPALLASFAPGIAPATDVSVDDAPSAVGASAVGTSAVGTSAVGASIDVAAAAAPTGDTARRSDLTVLVRGVPDAEELSRYEGFTVLCGSPAELATEPTFDTIIALDGLERLGTAEQDESTWAETLGLLKAALRPGGLLIIGFANPLGLHRLVTAPQPLTDSNWTPGSDDTRPASVTALTLLLGGATRTYACYPDPIAPLLVLPADARGGPAEAALARVYDAVGFADPETTPPAQADAQGRDDEPELLLTDPYPWVIESLRQGQPLAPGWIVVASADATALPSIDSAPEGPAGRTVESLIVGAAARRDLPAVRALLSSWQDSPAAGVVASQVICGPGGTLTPLVPASTPDQALHHLASRLVRATTGSHPWPAVTDAADLAATLAAMTGREPDREDVQLENVPPVAESLASREPLHRESRLPGGDASSRASSPPSRKAVLGGRDASPPASRKAIVPGSHRPPPVAELLAERDRLVRELAETRAQAAFLEAELTAREADLRGARRAVELLSGTGPARAGQAFVGGVRAARRLLRRRG